MKRHWPWEHKFSAISAQQILSDYLHSGTLLKEGVGTHETLVLLRCECGKVKTRKLHGHWSKESLEEAFKGS